MNEQEMIARIKRIERHLGLRDIPEVTMTDIKEYRMKRGCSFEYAKDVVLKHTIAELFQKETQS